MFEIPDESEQANQRTTFILDEIRCKKYCSPCNFMITSSPEYQILLEFPIINMFHFFNKTSKTIETPDSLEIQCASSVNNNKDIVFRIATAGSVPIQPLWCLGHVVLLQLYTSIKSNLDSSVYSHISGPSQFNVVFYLHKKQNCSIDESHYSSNRNEGKIICEKDAVIPSSLVCDNFNNIANYESQLDNTGKNYTVKVYGEIDEPTMKCTESRIYPPLEMNEVATNKSCFFYKNVCYLFYSAEFSDCSLYIGFAGCVTFCASIFFVMLYKCSCVYAC